MGAPAQGLASHCGAFKLSRLERTESRFLCTSGHLGRHAYSDFFRFARAAYWSVGKSLAIPSSWGECDCRTHIQGGRCPLSRKGGHPERAPLEVEVRGGSKLGGQDG